jgi:SAM-dependent methyltransferase
VRHSSNIERAGSAAHTGSPYRRPRPSHISAWNRQRKWKMFERAMAPAPTTKVLDVGYSEREWAEGDNYLEKHYPWPQRLTALGIEEHTQFSQRYPDVRVVRYAGGDFPFADAEFDVVWSNATLEHVGDRDAQVKFLAEIARTGRRAFVTTPNRHFPIEVHTRTPLLHFLPKSLFDRYLHAIKQGWAADTYMRLLSARELRAIIRDAGVSQYRIKRNHVGPFTLDFIVLIG